MNKYHKNVWLLNSIYLFHALVTAYAVVHVLFYREFFFTYTQISSLVIIGLITTLILEIPSGEFADLYGRKKALLIFAISGTLSAFIFLIGTNYWDFVIGVIFGGIQIAFWSGTLSAMLFESLKKLKKEKLFEKYFSYAHFLYIGTGIGTNYFIPILFNWNIKYPYYISLFLGIILIVLTLFLTETHKSRKYKQEKILSKYILQIKDSYRILKNNYDLVWILVFSISLSYSMIIFAHLINQPLIKQNFDFALYGLIFGLSTIVQTILTYYYPQILKKARKINVYLLIVLAWPISLILVLTKNIYLLIFFMGINWTLGSFRHIIFTSDANKLIKNDGERSTILSLESMIRALLIFILMPLIALIMDKISINMSIYILATISLIIGIIILIFRRN